MEINIKGTLQLLEASVKHGVKKFIFASTGGAIYGEHDYFLQMKTTLYSPLALMGSQNFAQRNIFIPITTPTD